MTTSPRHRVWTFFIGMLVAAVSPSTASASWDSFEARTPHLHIVLEHTELGSDVADLGDIAGWVRRIEAVLPPGARVDVFDHEVRVTCRGVCRGMVNRADRGPNWWAGDLETLFVIVADEVGASPRERRELLEQDARVYTVQVLETADRDEARALAEELNALEVTVESFVDVGGFPSPSEIARVVEVDGGDGLVVQRVEMGAFLDRAAAREASHALFEVTGRRGIVRTLAFGS